MCYEVVSSNGCGIHGRRPTLHAAQELAARIAQEALVDFGPLELQQVIEYPDRSRRYWVREGSRWMLWRHDRDIAERQPDWMWPCAVAGGER